MRKNQNGEIEEFAVKVISKAQVVAEDLCSHVVIEKRICEKVNHPNIMQFYRTFKDDSNLYFVL